MGPVMKRAIPVRQHLKNRQIPPHGIFTSKANLLPKIPVVADAPVPAVDETAGKPDVVQRVCSEVSGSVNSSDGSLEMSSRIGSKVRIGGAKTGTFLFCGKTSFSDGIWCGVSLDEPGGKNDGSVNGIRYFTCPPAHGTFVRPIKIEFLSSLDSGVGASVRTLPKIPEGSTNVKVAPTCRVPVSSMLKRPGGSTVISGKINKVGSARKIIGLKQRYLLETNVNSTTTIFSKETPTNLRNTLANGTENDPLQCCKAEAMPAALNSEPLRANSLKEDGKPIKPSKSCDNLPSSLNSTITINLNSTITVTSHNLNCEEKTVLTPEKSKELSVSSEEKTILAPEKSNELSVKDKCVAGIDGAGLSKLSDDEQCAVPGSLVLDCTFDVADSVISPESMSHRSQELFMNLSPSKASSPMQSRRGYPDGTSLLGCSFELSVTENLSSDGNLLHNDKKTKASLTSNALDLHMCDIDAVTSPAPLANQTIVIESHSAGGQCLNETFQVDDCTLHEGCKVSPTGISCETGASQRTNLKYAVNVPILEEDEQSVMEPKNVSSSDGAPQPVLNNTSFIKKKDDSSSPDDVTITKSVVSSTPGNLERDQLICDSGLISNAHCKINARCIEPEAIDVPQHNVSFRLGTNLNETFCCIERSDISPPAKLTTLMNSSSPKLDTSLVFADKCDEFEMEHGSCLFRDNPVSSTPACHSNKGQFISTLFTPIYKPNNWNTNLSPPEKSSMLPSKLSGPNVLQVSTSSDQSLGILSPSEMPDFTVAGSTCSSLGDDSPLSESFCNRMFPIEAENKAKKFSSILEFGGSPDCQQLLSVNKSCSKDKLPQPFQNNNEESGLASGSKFISKLACQNVPCVTKSNALSIISEELSDSEHDKSLKAKVTDGLRSKNKRGFAETKMDTDFLVGEPLAKCGKWQLDGSFESPDSLTSAELPDCSILDLSACAATRLPDDSLLDLNLDDSSKYNDGLI